MIRKYHFGKPLNTEAVIKEYPVEKGEIPCIKVKEGGKNLLSHDQGRTGLRPWGTGPGH